MKKMSGMMMSRMKLSVTIFVLVLSSCVYDLHGAKKDTIQHSRHRVAIHDISFDQPSQTFMQKHQQFLHILRCLLHIPYIATIESQDVYTIRSSAVLATLSTQSRLIYELMRTRNDTSLIKELLWPIPKTCGYAGGALYEYGRIIKALEVAQRNKVIDKKLHSLKIQQIIKVVLEISLRALVYKMSFENKDQTPTEMLLAELADVIELWRLLSRYTTFFVEADQVVKILDDADDEIQKTHPVTF